MYRVAWQILSTGFSGNGGYCLSKDEADEWISVMNNKYPDMNHWAELS
jgi:hypothetical protein